MRSRPYPLRPQVETLEGREVPATLFTVNGSNQIARFDSATPGTASTPVAIQGLAAGEQVVGSDFRPRTGQLYALAVDNGGAGTPRPRGGVRPVTGTLLRTLNPYGGFTGGVSVAAGDVNRDSVPDVITGAQAGGGPHVKVFDGATGNELFSFFAFGSDYAGGVRVGAGDTDRDGRVELLAGPALGPPVLRAFDFATGNLLKEWNVLTGANGVFVGGGLA